MKKLTRKSLPVLIATSLVLGSTIAFAEVDTHPNRGKMVDTEQNQQGYHGHKGGQKQGHKNGGHKMEREIWSQLELTDEQQAQIKTIKQDFHESMKAQVQDKSMKGSKEHQQALMQGMLMAETFDEAAMRSLLEDKADKEIERKLAFAKHKHDLFAVLTAEQKAKYTELKKEKMAAIKAKRAEMMEQHKADNVSQSE